MVGLQTKLFEAVSKINHTVCTVTLGWQPRLCTGVQFRFPWDGSAEDTGCHIRRRSLPAPSAVGPGRWPRPSTAFWETSSEEQSLLQREEQWNRASETPNTLLPI